MVKIEVAAAVRILNVADLLEVLLRSFHLERFEVDGVQKRGEVDQADRLRYRHACVKENCRVVNADGTAPHLLVPLLSGFFWCDAILAVIEVAGQLSLILLFCFFRGTLGLVAVPRDRTTWLGDVAARVQLLLAARRGHSAGSAQTSSIVALHLGTLLVVLEGPLPLPRDVAFE